jgi:hypothetical protein
MHYFWLFIIAAVASVIIVALQLWAANWDLSVILQLWM